MLDALKDLFSSKKFLAALSGAIAYGLIRLAGKAGIALDPDTASQVGDRVLAMAATYVAAQGAADFGKHAAEIQADTPKPAGPPPAPAPPS